MDAGTETNARASTGTTSGKPHLFTVWDYHRMTEAGVLDEDSRVELIRGQITDMSPIGAPHFRTVNRLTRLLVPLVGAQGIVSVQNPVRLDGGSEPQPDVTILHPRMDEDDAGTPGPADVLPLIEVADSSLGFDRATKLPLYAEAGIRDYWIVNLQDRAIEAHRDPEGGRCVRTRRIGFGEPLDILLLPGLTLPTVDLMR
ncbi:MAG TPA: Uma2 family endonuclease [Acetobacteraceae bacterium]